MKFSMPILAIVVALLFVASQSVYTVDQRKYAVKFQLGEVVETKTTAGLYFKMPLVQNVKFYDKVNLTLDNPEPDRMTTSEKKPLLVDFVVLWRIIDVRQYYISVQGDEEAARRRLSQTVRANLAEEFNKHDVHEAISSARDAITSVTQQKANADAKSIGVEVIDVRLRRVELPPDVTGPVYQRMESERRRVANELRSLGGAESEKIRADADRQRQVILAARGDVDDLDVHRAVRGEAQFGALAAGEHTERMMCREPDRAGHEPVRRAGRLIVAAVDEHQPRPRHRQPQGVHVDRHLRADERARRLDLARIAPAPGLFLPGGEDEGGHATNSP